MTPSLDIYCNIIYKKIQIYENKGGIKIKELFMKKIGEWLKNKIYKIFNKTEDEKVNINVINGGKEIMDLIAKCKYCGKEFLDKDNFDFQEDCILHEAIGHLNLKERFKTVTGKAIHMLNKKYNIQAYYEDIEINPDYNECCDCLRDELCGIKCTFHIYFDKNIKSYVGISIDFDSLEEDLDINELIENMEVDYKKYINGELNPIKKFRYEYDFDKIPEEFKDNKLVRFYDNLLKGTNFTESKNGTTWVMMGKPKLIIESLEKGDK